MTDQNNVETSENRDADKSLTEAVSKEILTTSIDQSIDYAEIGIDELLTGEVLKEIPIVKTLVSIAKIGISIKEKVFIKKLLSFLQEFHSQKSDDSTLSEFRSRFDKDPKYRSKVTEQIMIYLDAFLNVEKSKILAKLFRAHIEGKFDWDYFNYLSVCLNNAHPMAFSFLQKISSNNFEIPEDPDDRNAIDLQRDGSNEALLYACGIAFEVSSWSSGFQVSQLGKDLYNFGIK